jgi:hypothetical protein
MEQAGVPRSVAMKLTGHKTENVYRRYDRERGRPGQRGGEVDRGRVTFCVTFGGPGLKYCSTTSRLRWLRGSDLNRRPLGYEGKSGPQDNRNVPTKTNEDRRLPDCHFVPPWIVSVALLHSCFIAKPGGCHAPDRPRRARSRGHTDHCAGWRWGGVHWLSHFEVGITSRRQRGVTQLIRRPHGSAAGAFSGGVNGAGRSRTRGVGGQASGGVITRRRETSECFFKTATTGASARSRCPGSSPVYPGSNTTDSSFGLGRQPRDSGHSFGELLAAGGIVDCGEIGFDVDHRHLEGSPS